MSAARLFWRAPTYKGPERRHQPRRRIRPLRALIALLTIVVAGYALGALSLMVRETRLIFEAVQSLGDARPPFAFQQIDLPRGDGLRQFAWLMRPPATGQAAWALYLHGSPSTIASPVNIAHYALLRSLGLHVMAPEYRGFGGLQGTPSEAALLADARAAYDYLRERERVPADRVVLYGWSLGGAVAVDLATRVETAAVILEGAPASMADLHQQRYPLFPVRLLMRNPLQAVEKIGRSRAPVLILHSPADAVVPIADAHRLQAAAAAAPARLVEIDGGHVDAIEVDAARMAETIRAFLAEHGLELERAAAQPNVSSARN